MPVRFFSEDIRFQLRPVKLRKNWLLDVIKQSDRICGNVNYIFCSDIYLLEINKKYLQHDYYTDIITFDLSEDPKVIDAEIYISMDRVRENSRTHSIKLQDEIDRILIHGLLHLLGFKDSTETEKEIMRKEENRLLDNRNF